MESLDSQSEQLPGNGVWRSSTSTSSSCTCTLLATGRQQMQSVSVGCQVHPNPRRKSHLMIHLARYRWYRDRDRPIHIKVELNPGTKKDAGTAIWSSKLSPGGPRGFRKVLYYVRPLAAASWRLGFHLQLACCRFYSTTPMCSTRAFDKARL